MAASLPPPEPEGDQQGDGEEVDEDLEKKVHRRGSDEPDEPDHHRPQHRAEDQPELMTPTPSGIGRPARQAKSDHGGQEKPGYDRHGRGKPRGDADSQEHKPVPEHGPQGSGGAEQPGWRRSQRWGWTREDVE